MMKKVELKLRKNHPTKAFRIGQHVVGMDFNSYDLNESELKELASDGCKAWLISKKEFDELEKQNTPKKK